MTLCNFHLFHLFGRCPPARASENHLNVQGRWTMINKRQALYRFYDAQDRLLYVGITVSVLNRWGAHAVDKPWWGDVVRATIEHRSDRASALIAEKAAIINEKPLYNKQHNAGARRDQFASPDRPGQPLYSYSPLRNPEYTRVGTLEYVWELDGSSISDNYCSDPDCEDYASPDQLLRIWLEWRKKRGENNSVADVYWGVHGSRGTFEHAPFATGPSAEWEEDFLTGYTWPVRVDTGERVRWPGLPVADSLWRGDHGSPAAQMDKGGFIQELTGWKPSPLVPQVNLNWLLGIDGDL